MNVRRVKREKEEAVLKAAETLNHNHAENEWGITLDGGEDEVVQAKQEETFVQVKKEQTLEELMNSMKKLQAK